MPVPVPTPVPMPVPSQIYELNVDGVPYNTSISLTIYSRYGLGICCGSQYQTSACVYDPAVFDTHPEAAQLAGSFAAAICNIQTTADCSDPSEVPVSYVEVPGCGNRANGDGVTLEVEQNFVTSLGLSDAYDDCFLSYDELVQTPAGLSLVTQLAQAQADDYGVDVNTVDTSTWITGIHTDGDSDVGCDNVAPGDNGGFMGGGVDLTLDPNYLDSLTDGTNNADDGVIDMDEIASDEDAMMLALEFQLAVCNQLGICDNSAVLCNPINCADVMITGINVDNQGDTGRRRRQLAEHQKGHVTLTPVYKLANGHQMLIVDRVKPQL